MKLVLRVSVLQLTNAILAKADNIIIDQLPPVKKNAQAITSFLPTIGGIPLNADTVLKKQFIIYT